MVPQSDLVFVLSALASFLFAGSLQSFYREHVLLLKIKVQIHVSIHEVKKSYLLIEKDKDGCMNKSVCVFDYGKRE